MVGARVELEAVRATVGLVREMAPRLEELRALPGLVARLSDLRAVSGLILRGLVRRGPW
jgi:hypothetical protein